jgi:xanthine dehydrogenase large subunit
VRRFDLPLLLHSVDCRVPVATLNSGWSPDLSNPVMQRMLYGALNAYHCEHVRVIGKICKTNIASHTAFRGFGMPQVCVRVSV